MLYVLLILVIICCWWTHSRLEKIEDWILLHQTWMIEHHARHLDLEKSLCAIEKFAHDDVSPHPSTKFCTGQGGGPGDGFGGSAPPNGF